MAYNGDFTIADQWDGRNIMIYIDNSEFTVIDHLMVVGFNFFDRSIESIFSVDISVKINTSTFITLITMYLHFWVFYYDSLTNNIITK